MRKTYKFDNKINFRIMDGDRHDLNTRDKLVTPYFSPGKTSNSFFRQYSSVLQQSSNIAGQ